MRKVRQYGAGFTLLELLLVLVIAGITLGVVSFNALPSPQQNLQREAQRLALLMQLARDEAIVRNQPIAFEAVGDGGYRFVVRSGNEWVPIEHDDMLRARDFERPPVTLILNTDASANSQSAGSSQSAVRIVFGREPVDKPFTLTLRSGTSSVELHADGIGHYVVD
ncbi:MAG: GspH/FimT family protein [Herbaspirillum sp.]